MQSAVIQTTQLSRAQLRAIKAELEHERRRIGSDNARNHVLVQALRRLSDGTYGRCFVCGDGIPYDRLAVMPETMYCIDCGRRS